MSWDNRLFQRHLETRRFGRELTYLEEVDSTNQWLLDQHEHFSLNGCVVVAGHQTAGRGRQGRAWYDKPHASLLFSVLLRYPATNVASGFMPHLPAIALAGVLANRVGGTHEILLKWPNDVLLNRRKLAGVLGQSASSTA
jgi:BirA family biotin operon repressor/biotin-[acetyl-CoA-carboxylase] ligase